MYIYHCKLGGAVRQVRVDQGRINDYFALIGFITGLDRAAAEAILHSGRPIRHPRATFYAICVPDSGATVPETGILPGRFN